MTIIAAWLYLIGLMGLYVTARDLNGGLLKTWRPRINLIFWPIMIPIAALGDLYDRLRHDAPHWLNR